MKLLKFIFARDLTAAPYYRGVRYNEVSARREWLYSLLRLIVAEQLWIKSLNSTKSLGTPGLPFDANVPPQISAGIVRRGFSRVYFSPMYLRLWQLLITLQVTFYNRYRLHFFLFLCSVTRHKRTRLFCRIIILWEDSWTCPEFKQLWCNAFIPFPRIFISLNEFVTSYRAGYFDRFFIPSGGRVRHFVMQKAWRFLYPS